MLRPLRDGVPVIIADGGIKQTGDIPKAIAAGADSCNGWRYACGTDESPGKKYYTKEEAIKFTEEWVL